MNDLKNGKVDIFGFEVTPNTTQEAFEKALGSKFTKKCLDPEAAFPSIYRFSLNGQVGVSPESFVLGKHIPFEFFGMTFVNVLVLFRDNQISEIELATDMNPFVANEVGEKSFSWENYSQEKEQSNFKTLHDWAFKNFGEPSFRYKNVVIWNCGWGSFRPNSLGAPWGLEDNPKFLIEYGRGYNV